ncbi:MAG: hypothetical protein K5750_06895 [Eubacterium sp.]|nr:hypothetical protein [Eubacterium sp.]
MSKQNYYENLKNKENIERRITEEELNISVIIKAIWYQLYKDNIINAETFETGRKKVQ